MADQDLSARDRHLIARALAISLEIMNRSHPRHTPGSDADDMADLYLRLVPDEMERRVWEHACRWLLAGGLDLRDRPFDPLPGGSSGAPLPSPGGGEPVPVSRSVAA